MSALFVPDVTAAEATIRAGIRYAEGGLYVLPIRNGSKHPGSVLGSRWQDQSSREPDQVAGWLAGTDHGLAVHVGRSGAVCFDVDHPDKVSPVLAGALAEFRPPYQSTRPGQPGRGHYLFGSPPGRHIGNGKGGLAGGWGEVRGRNGVIVVSPSRHPDDGGQYEWLTTGAVPMLPDALASLLPDGAEAVDAATDTEVAAFIAAHTTATRPHLLDVVLKKFAAAVAAGESVHETAVATAAWACREAASGCYSAAEALRRLEAAFTAAFPSSTGRLRPGPGELAGVIAWAIGQATPEEVEKTRQRMESGMPTEDAAPGAAAPSAATSGHRALSLTAASTIKVRPVTWLWDGRLALGTMALLGGREGVGKSTVAYTLAADVTRGRLPGAYEGQPRGVIVAATEDSWEHTIVPRLMAADADLDRVYRVDVVTAEGVDTAVSLPRDLAGLERAVTEVGAGLILLDPLLSRLDAGLDTHKDAEVRLALEPLTAVANRSRAAVLGLIHVNKSTSEDPLTMLMGSRAFAAVARAVLFVMVDPDDEAGRLLGQPKNNLGRADLATLTFRIESARVADTDEGPVYTGRLRWGDERDGSIQDALAAAGENAEARSATGEAAAWLKDYLTSVGGCADSAKIKEEAKAVGHSLGALKRARVRIMAISESSGFPRRTYWRLLPFVSGGSKTPTDDRPDEPTGQNGRPAGESPSGTSLGESELTGLTGPTGQNDQGDLSSGTSGSSWTSGIDPPARVPTQRPSTTTVGPCLGCSARITRYGDDGRPFCPPCDAKIRQ